MLQRLPCFPQRSSWVREQQIMGWLGIPAAPKRLSLRWEAAVERSGGLAGQTDLQAPSSGLRFKKVLKPSIRSARRPRPSAKRDGSVTVLKPSMNIACGSTYWSLPCMAARACFNVGLSGNASQGGIIGDQPFWCQAASWAALIPSSGV